jgi:hypothetical protein
MHVSVGPKGSEPPTPDEREIADIIFNRPDAVGGIPYKDMIKHIMELEEISKATAKRRITRFLACNLIKKSSTEHGSYVRGDA